MFSPFQLRGFSTALLFLVLCVAGFRAQQPSLPAQTGSLTTAERLETETWWPTKETLPLRSFAGSASCTGCHAQEAAGAGNAMAHAAVRAENSPFLQSGPQETAMLNGYTFRLLGRSLSVSRGGTTESAEIAWDFGAGSLAHTFLFPRDGHWVQSEVTAYTRDGRLDTTTGFNTVGGVDVHSALGQQLTPAEARTCFGCHTVHSTSSSGFAPEHAEAGLGCEACHGPALAHTATSSQAGGKTAVFNPAALSPADAIDFCGACHRTTADALAAGGPEVLHTAASEKLTCVACHDPHAPLDRAAAHYDRTCLGCHTVVDSAPAAQHVAKVAAPGGERSCVGCHMPRVAVPSMHGSFSDHRIRIAQAGETFPD